MLSLHHDEYREYRLFGRILEEELDRRAPLRREIEHRQAQADDAIHVGLTDSTQWGLDRLSEHDEFVQRVAESISPSRLTTHRGTPATLPGTVSTSKARPLGLPTNSCPPAGGVRYRHGSLRAGSKTSKRSMPNTTRREPPCFTY